MRTSPHLLLLLLLLTSLLPLLEARGRRRKGKNKTGTEGGLTNQRPPNVDRVRRSLQQRDELSRERPSDDRTDEAMPLKRKRENEDGELFMPTDIQRPDDPAIEALPVVSTGRFKNHQQKTIEEQARHIQSNLITQMENAHSDPDAGEWLLEDELCGGKGCTDPQGTTSLRGADNSLVYTSDIDWNAKHLDEKACCRTRAEFYVKHTHLFTKCTECDDNGNIIDRGEEWKSEAHHKGSSEYGNNKKKMTPTSTSNDEGNDAENTSASLNSGESQGRIDEGVVRNGDAIEEEKGEEANEDRKEGIDGSASEDSEKLADNDAKILSLPEGEDTKEVGAFDRSADATLPLKSAPLSKEMNNEGESKGRQQANPSSKRQMKRAAKRARKAARADKSGGKGNSGKAESIERMQKGRNKTNRQAANPNSKRQMKRAAKKAARKARKEAAKKENGKK